MRQVSLILHRTLHFVFSLQTHYFVRHKLITQYILRLTEKANQKQLIINKFHQIRKITQLFIEVAGRRGRLCWADVSRKYIDLMRNLAFPA